MCVTQKLCIVCFLMSHLWIKSAVNAQSTHSPDRAHAHLHDHDGYQLREIFPDQVALNESKYFVNKLFERYGGKNGTITFDMFANLLHSLGLGKNSSGNSGEKSEDPDHGHAGEHGHIHLPKPHKDDTVDQHHHTELSPVKNKSKSRKNKNQLSQDHKHDSHDAHKDVHDHGSDHKSKEKVTSKVNPRTDSSLSDNHDDHHSEHSKDHHDHSSHTSEKQSSNDRDIDSHTQSTHDHDSHTHTQSSHDHDHLDHDHSEHHDEHTSVSSDSDVEITTEKHKKKNRKNKKKNRKRQKQAGQKSISKRSTEIEFHSDHSYCLTKAELLQSFHLDKKKQLFKDDFLYLCPAILYQIDMRSCKPNNNLPRVNNHGGHDHSQHEHPHTVNVSTVTASSSAKVWGYSTIAVVVISLGGLLGVAVIPIMQKVFYNHLLQFLVALAVGALSGDALLHLLPHAIGGGHGKKGEHSHHDEGEVNSHLNATYKGLIALTGIFFFFLMERTLTIMTDIRRKKKQLKRLKTKKAHKKCMINTHTAVGAKLSTHLDQDNQTCEEMVMIVHPNKALRNLADDTHDSLIHHGEHHTHSQDGGDEEENMSLSHSHHGHSHNAKDVKSQSVAAIAWMVILGDGIHNFSDGLAIGAAFANSITGGVSTSIAVLCHELPHEIGDFAVLIRAGMNIRQAVMYNCVSSILCFIGMLIGVFLGNLNEASLWIFACVGGMFLYIAMVDMLPEMTSVETKHGENPYCHLLFQCAGMMLGAGIMLVIAVYEPELLSVLDKHT